MTGLELSAIEVASGLVFGQASRIRLPPPRPGGVREALRLAILPALERSPCLVSFSGGRDSSCVLAAAVDVARREGLPLPVPVTLRFPGDRDAAESDWQDRVVSHLGVADWERLSLDDELDAVGPVATRGLARHGLLWPFNAHFHVPVLEAAAGGSVLTGIGGDEALGVSRWARANDVLSGRRRPRLGDTAPVALALAPRPLRRVVLRRRTPAWPWLTPEGRRQLAAELGRGEADEPRRYRPRLEQWLGLRSLEVGLRSLALLAADAGATISHPLADRHVLAALAAAAPRYGPADRGELTEGVFGRLLPRAVYRRSTKASFDRVFWNRHARALAAAWSGEGVDPSVVDVEALRVEWSQPLPDPHTLTALQAAWLQISRAARPAASMPSRADGQRPPRASPSCGASSAPSRAAPPA